MCKLTKSREVFDVLFGALCHPSWSGQLCASLRPVPPEERSSKLLRSIPTIHTVSEQTRLYATAEARESRRSNRTLPGGSDGVLHVFCRGASALRSLWALLRISSVTGTTSWRFGPTTSWGNPSSTLDTCSLEDLSMMRF